MLKHVLKISLAVKHQGSYLDAGARILLSARVRTPGGESGKVLWKLLPSSPYAQMGVAFES